MSAGRWWPTKRATTRPYALGRSAKARAKRASAFKRRRSRLASHRKARRDVNVSAYDREREGQHEEVRAHLRGALVNEPEAPVFTALERPPLPPAPRYVEASGAQLDSPLDSYHPEAQLFERLSPEEFLRAAVDISPEDFRKGVVERDGKRFATGYDRDSYERVRGRIEAGLPTDPLFLDVDVGDQRHPATISKHEGRHRALAAYDLGIAEVPVRVFVGRRDKQGHWDYLPTSSLTGYQRHNLDVLLGRM